MSALDTYKSNFYEAKSKYFEEKEKAQQDYKNAEGMGLVNKDQSFNDWTYMHAPDFGAALQTIQASAAQLQAAASKEYGDQMWENLDEDEYSIVLPSEDEPGKKGIRL